MAPLESAMEDVKWASHTQVHDHIEADFIDVKTRISNVEPKSMSSAMKLTAAAIVIGFVSTLVVLGVNWGNTVKKEEFTHLSQDVAVIKYQVNNNAESRKVTNEKLDMVLEKLKHVPASK